MLNWDSQGRCREGSRRGVRDKEGREGGRRGEMEAWREGGEGGRE